MNRNSEREPETLATIWSIGVISDTHGLLRPEALTALAGSTQIVHAGDVGPETILETLRHIAPTVAVRGNWDRDMWVKSLPVDHLLDCAGKWLYVLHDLSALDFNPAKSGIDVVISGHSHQPKIERRDGVLYVNPGSAGRKRFSLPITLAKLEISQAGIEAKLIPLSDNRLALSQRGHYTSAINQAVRRPK